MTPKEPTCIKLASLATASVLLLGACGGDDAGVTGDADVTVHGLDNLKFDEEAYTAEAGEITFEYVNDGRLNHTLLVEGEEGFKLTINSQGDTDSGSVQLEPGEYRLYCDVPGHGGMVAALTVEEAAPTAEPEAGETE